MFNWVPKIVLDCFDLLSLLCDWSGKLAPPSQLIKCRTTTNTNLVSRIFPRLKQVAWFYSEFSFVNDDVKLRSIGGCDYSRALSRVNRFKKLRHHRKLNKVQFKCMIKVALFPNVFLLSFFSVFTGVDKLKKLWPSTLRECRRSSRVSQQVLIQERVE